jgi:tetratricopeptide (TPR) repeat protein
VGPRPNDARDLRAAADAVLELHESGRLEDALVACDELIARADDLGDEVVRESAFAAHFERGALLAELGDFAAAARAHLEAAEVLPFDRADPDQAHELALLLLNAGTSLDAAGDPERALSTYDRLCDELGEAADPVTSELVVRGRVNRAVSLLGLERLEDALAGAGALAGQLDSDDPVHAEQLGMAQRVRAAALRGLGRAEEAVVALAQAETLAAVSVGGARSQAAAAQGERAELLVELGRADEAIEVLDATVERLSDDPEVAPVVDDLRRAEADLLEALGEHDRAARLRAEGSAVARG